MPSIIKAGNAITAGVIFEGAVDGTLQIKTSAADGSAVVTAISIAASGAATFATGASLPYMLVQDQKASGVNGGGALVTTVETRVLNTVVSNSIVGASLASNQITLPIGTYLIRAEVPAHATNRAKGFLFNVTSGLLSIGGSPEFASAAGNAGAKSIVVGRITVVSTTVFEIRMYTETASVTVGFGVASGVAATGVEIYTSIEITKVG